MKLVIDAAIPYVRPHAEELGTCVFLPADQIMASAVRDADALIVRTRTRCDERLLQDARVRFVATATIGFDHLDTAYLRRRDIAWTNCPGCNAGSVAQYVEAALLRLSLSGILPLGGHPTLGIVGVGHVGTLVARVALRLGMHVLLCDPPRAQRGEHGFCTLEEIIAHSDAITFHVPLERDGLCPTYHMAADRFFHLVARAGHRPVIMNTSRGEVVATAALVQALDDGTVRAAVVDTWEDEPHISPELLHRAYIATPHIAGYSADGKARATEMALHAVCRHFRLRPSFEVTPPPLPEDYEYRPYGFGEALCATLPPVPSAADYAPLTRFDPLRDTAVLKLHAEWFEQMRSNYPLRRE